MNRGYEFVILEDGSREQVSIEDLECAADFFDSLVKGELYPEGAKTIYPKEETNEIK